MPLLRICLPVRVVRKADLHLSKPRILPLMQRPDPLDRLLRHRLVDMDAARVPCIVRPRRDLALPRKEPHVVAGVTGEVDIAGPRAREGVNVAGEMARRVDDVEAAVGEEIDRVRDGGAEGLPGCGPKHLLGGELLFDLGGVGGGGLPVAHEVVADDFDWVYEAGVGPGDRVGRVVGGWELDCSVEWEEVFLEVCVGANFGDVLAVQEILRTGPDDEVGFLVREVRRHADVVPVDVG